MALSVRVSESTPLPVPPENATGAVDPFISTVITSEPVPLPLTVTPTGTDSELTDTVDPPGPGSRVANSIVASHVMLPLPQLPEVPANVTAVLVATEKFS